MTFSGFVMYFIILTTGTVLFKAGIHQIDTVEEAALALKPLAGDLAYLLFAIGIIGTGLIAIPVLSGSLSYIFTETFGWEQGLDKNSTMQKVLFNYCHFIAFRFVVKLCWNFSNKGINLHSYSLWDNRTSSYSHHITHFE